MTDHQKKNWKRYCSEPLELVENYQQAEAENFKGWCMHHKLEIQPDGTRVSRQELKDKDLYYDRPANELVFMKVCEHNRLHFIGNTFNKGNRLSAEHRQKLSEALKGKHLSAAHRKKLSESLSGKNHPFFGKHHSAETCKKLSASHKGMHKSAESRHKLSEAKKGIHWWNDGVSCKLARECPGEGWKRGRLKASMASCKT